MVLVASFGVAAQAQQAAATAPSVPRSAQPDGHLAHTALERRLQVLSKELNLSDVQRKQVREILTAQRTRVHQIWTDPAIDPNERAPATKAAAERSGDAIRALLTEEQKKKYNQVKPDLPVEPGSQRSVEEWIHQMGTHEPVEGQSPGKQPASAQPANPAGTPADQRGQ
jgi:hypothetical protein